MAQSNDQNIEIDESLYSRQLFVLGHDFMRRLVSSSVLISGLDGLGVEVAKNVILGGVRHVVLHDTQNTTYQDLSSQYYLTETDIGKNRALACGSKLAELNSYVRVEHSAVDLTPDFLSKFKAIVLCDYVNLAAVFSISDYCHKSDIKLILASTRGLFGQLFCDFGESFSVLDPTGEEPASSVIESIAFHPENGIVKLTENSSGGFSRDDTVVFSDVRGASGLNAAGPIQVKESISPFVFSIGDTTKYGKYEGGGVVTQVKKVCEVKFKSYRQSLDEPEIVPSDFAKMDRQNVLHLAFRCLGPFVESNNGFPRPRDAKAALMFVEFCKKFDANKEVVTSKDAEDLLTEFASQAVGDFSPMSAVIGSIAAQEVIKALSGKFMPLNQYLYFDALECLPDDRSKLTLENCAPTGSRYDAQVAIFGRDFVETLASQNVFVVGTGALGCEILKNLAMMGVGCSPAGHVTVTDMDLIEKSNLNRQFLFRPADLHHLKSERAAAAVLKMNPRMQITAHRHRVGPETEEIYGDEFFGSLNFVVNALDNVEARKYMDQRCVLYRRPLLESGTLGTKANIQVVLPDLTESYSSSADPPEKSFPMCTVKNFPSAIEHTLAWAKEMFTHCFSSSMHHVEQFIQDPQFIEKTLKSANKNQMLETLQDLKTILVDTKPKTFGDCVKWARLLWQDNFHNHIAQMLFNFPADAKTSEGLPFWSGSKRCPTIQHFDINNPLHINFIVAASNLQAEMFGLAQVRDVSKIAELASKVVVPPFKPQHGVRIATTDQEVDSMHGIDENDEEAVLQRAGELISQLPDRKELKDRKFVSIDFEKDDDSNFHMDFIVAASNTRAKIYDIPPADRLKSKGIAGRIIPAIATTTSVTVGLVCLEMVKIVQGHIDLEKYKNGFLNLAFPFFAFSTPIMPKIYSYHGKKWTLWDRFTISGEPSLGELIEKFEKEESLVVTMASAGTLLCYANFMAPPKLEARRKSSVRAIVEELSGKPIPKWQRFLILELCCENVDDGEDVDIPFVQYLLN